MAKASATVVSCLCLTDFMVRSIVVVVSLLIAIMKGQASSVTNLYARLCSAVK